jgi:hypothetical protein
VEEALDAASRARKVTCRGGGAWVFTSNAP